MGWKETLIDAGEDIVTTAARLLSQELLHRIFDGHDSHTALAVKRVADATVKAALDAAELEARNGVAAKLLPERMRELAEKIAADMERAFRDDGSVQKLEVPIEYITQEEFDRIEAEKRARGEEP